ncbi:DNA topoisomerase III [Francisellaceae bacterium]|nr:DNA topoisomerase III [Francisellaceae bacterium]
MRVFLAEKPSQGSDIAKVLGCTQRGDGYLKNDSTIVTWGIGHLLQPADPDAYGEEYKSWKIETLPIVPDEWRTVPNPKTKSQLKAVKACLKQASEVVIATDADREGELIGRLILNHAKYKGPLKRLWLSALDEPSIRKALNEIKDASETEPLYWAGLARQQADWLAGMNYTRACTTLFTSGGGNVMSVGRVQTPTLRLIVERDLEIENFKPKTFFTIAGAFGTSPSFITDWIVPECYQGDEEKHCLKREFVEEVKSTCEGKTAQVTKYEVADKSRDAPLCLSISDLQKHANDQYGYDLKQTLDTAQSLYEKHKATTYPRSGCKHLPLSQFDDAREILNTIKKLDPDLAGLIDTCDSSLKSKCWNDKKVSEESHHALIPTLNGSVNLNQMSEMERNVYDIIRRSYIAQFLPKYTYKETQIELDCEGQKFKTNGTIPINQGWKIAFIEESSQPEKASQELPALELGGSIVCSTITTHTRETAPSAHYNDKTIVSAMENCGRRVEDEAARKMLNEVKGIGTGATRAEIINTLKRRFYVTKKGKSIISTDKARELIQRLPDELTSLEITSSMEGLLTLIAQGKGYYESFMASTESAIHKHIESLKTLSKDVKKIVLNPCPECGNELIRRKSKNSDGYWWGCSNYKAGCKASFTEKNGKLVGKKDAKETTRDCPVCGKDKLVQRKSSKTKKTFWACKNDSCEALYPHENGKPVYVPFNMELPSTPVKESKPPKSSVENKKPVIQKASNSIAASVKKKPIIPDVVKKMPKDGEIVPITKKEFDQAKSYYMGDSKPAVAPTKKDATAGKNCPTCGEELNIRKTKTKLILLCPSFPVCDYKEISGL